MKKFCVVFWLLVLFGPAYGAQQGGLLFEEADGSPTGWVYKAVVPSGSLSLANNIGTLNLGTWADAAYLRLDATNGPVTGEAHFGAGIRGDSAGCTTPTTLVIDGAPGSVGGVDYNVDVFGVGCSSGAVTITREEWDEFVTICGEGPSGDITDLSTFTPGTDNVRLCMIDLSAIFGGPVYISLLIPSSDTCATLLDTALGPGHGLVATIDDENFLKWNPSICTYDDRDRLNTYTIVSGWNDPVTVTTDGEMAYEWKIDDDGDAIFADVVSDDVRIGAELPQGDGFFVADLSVNTDYELDDTTGQAAYGAAVIREFTTSEACAADCGSGGGLYVSVGARPSHDFAGIFQAANYESLLYTDNTIGGMEVIRFLNYAWGDFEITGDYTTINASGPKVTLANSDPTVPTYRGIKITDWEICGTCTVTLTDNIGIDIGDLTAGATNYGIKIATFTNTGGNDYGIYNEADTYLADTEVSGTLKAATYQAGSGAGGITDNTSYWLCTAADCSATCQVTIEDGLITGCP